MSMFSHIRSWFSSKEVVEVNPSVHIRNMIKDHIHAGDEVSISFKDMDKYYGVDLPRRINLDPEEKKSRFLRGTVTGKRLITGPTDCWMLEVSRIRVDNTGNKQMKTVVFLEDEIDTLHSEHYNKEQT